MALVPTLCRYCGYTHNEFTIPDIIIFLKQKSNSMIGWKYNCTSEIYHHIFMTSNKYSILGRRPCRVFIYNKNLSINYMLTHFILIKDINEEIRNLFISLLNISYCTVYGILYMFS